MGLVIGVADDYQFPSCTAVLTQIETVQRYYGSYIDVRTYKSVLLDIHEKVYAAAGTTKATFRYDNYQN